MIIGRRCRAEIDRFFFVVPPTPMVMSEKLVSSAWRYTLQLLLGGGAIGAMCLAYLAMTGLATGQFLMSLTQLMVGLGMTIALLWIARHRDELVEG
jgi:formate/nitrite transporter FocA (FNT family)